MRLFVHPLKQGGRAIDTYAHAKAPDGISIGHVHGVLPRAKALVAQAVQQLIFHLFT